MTRPLIDTSVATAAADLLAPCANAPGCNRHLLIDTAFVPSIRKIAGWRLRPQASLYAGLGGQDLDEIAPRLLAIDPEHDLAFVDAVLCRLDGQPALSVLHSDLTLDALARHLASYVFVSAAPDDQRFVLRFTDTRILPGLVAALGDAQRRQFVGPLRAWRYVARDGRVASLPGAADAVATPGPLRLDACQFAGLIDGSEPDAILAQLHAHGALPAVLSPAAAHARVVTELARATSAGITAAPDRMTWCAMALGSDDTLRWDLPPLAAAVERAKTGEASLADSLQEQLDAA